MLLTQFYQDYDLWEDECPDGYPENCPSCQDNPQRCSIDYYEWTAFGQNICEDGAYDAEPGELCREDCVRCSHHEECESGCCAISDIDGEMLCREFCYDEFEQPLFDNSKGWSKEQPRVCRAGKALGVVAVLFWMLICCSLCVPVCALICVAKACRDRTPIDLRIH